MPRLSLLALLLAYGGIACAESGDYQPRNTQDPGDKPPSPEETVKLISLPEGFQATLFAGEPDVRQPVAMALDARGRLWVAESYSYQEWQEKGEDRILIFEDTDNDGRHDTRKIFWTGGNHVSGMTVGWGGVWVCDAPNLLFLPDRDRDDVPDGEPEIVLDGWSTEAKHNFFNGLTIGIDGWLYGRHGITAPSAVGAPGTPEEDRARFDCSIWRYHPYGRQFEVVCRGTTNPWGLDWNAAGEAFFTNNVNGHLWHVIPGAFYPRMGDRPDKFSEHVYEQIPMCADHLHHAGTTDDWSKTRGGKGVHDQLGGGHSHCGAMIYQGGKWPEQYRGKIFMGNIHGRRVNVDRLERRGSGYVGKHESDFLKVGTEWYRGVQLLSGPDGDVYLSDWCDFGECHDSDGVHRASGRIYKIIYGKPSPKEEIDLFTASQEKLIEYQLDKNEWFARMARHVLQQRAMAGELKEPAAFVDTLRKVFSTHPESAARLRVLLTLHATGMLPPSALMDLIRDEDEIIRTWAVRLCAEPRYQADPSLAIPVDAADESLRVRLAWASLLQKSDFGPATWRVAEQLAGDPAIAGDPNLPLMIWYGIRERAGKEVEPALNFLEKAAAGRLKTLVARRLSAIAPGELVAYLAGHPDAGERAAVLEGMASGLEEADKVEIDAATREAWGGLFAELQGDAALRSFAWSVSRLLDPAGFAATLESIYRESDSPEDLRRALSADKQARVLVNSKQIPRLREIQEIRSGLIHALAAAPKSLMNDFRGYYAEATPEDKNILVLALCSQPETANFLLDQILAADKAGEDWIRRSALNGFHAREIQNLKDGRLRKKLQEVWGRFGSVSGEKRETIRYWESQLTPDILANADVQNGHAKFQMLCMACHTLKGEGNHIGPDLTAANRGDVSYLLENIIDPNATLPQDFRLVVVTKKDGSAVSGNIQRETESAVTIRTLTDEVTVKIGDIAERAVMEQSLMPEGLLLALQPDEVRDLIAFLQQ